ncbi:J domain-containing protein [Hymenobacter sp. RP-2-7]|uniref:J domain-containing protein n=1 Tax=Hymenobacter polaris TaxID=2682546 RepID=A0A7Y0FMF7_9BACT|nr:J domain-containing protein [Hymenobacter polaris]NML65369.1 J domain-containing protein [Hymenobacter polaris]
MATLRTQLQALRDAQAQARLAYWRQVGPLAAATVAARRALYEPLEAALPGGYLTRAEEQQVTELLVAIARDLEARFGEDEAAVLARYAPVELPTEEPERPLPATEPTTPSPPERPTAQQRRQQRTQAAAEKARTADDALLGSTKAAYRELARQHHPDRAAQADTATQQAQTALMQRITAAYAAGDLAALLTLLAEETTSEASEELLARYTQALTQQRTQLSQQLAAAQVPAADAPWSGTPKQQRTRLREVKRSLRAEIDYLALLQRQLAEPASLRLALRELAKTGV